MYHLKLLILAGMIGAGAAGAATYYVAPGGSDAPGTAGTDWTTALASISNAVVSYATQAGDVVLVTNDSYNLTQEVLVSVGITVKSFNGVPAATILDCGGNARAFQINHADALIAGFTITNATAELGGGVRLVNGTISNCVITGCRASNGGGIYVTQGSVLDSRMIGNYATNYGGGLRVHSTGIVNIRRSEFSGNTAYTNTGGGISMGANTVVDACMVNSNTGQQGGGVYAASGGQILNTTSCYNNAVSATSGNAGGGLYLDSGAVASNCLVVANYTGGNGGAAGVRLGAGELLNSIVSNNTDIGRGAGVYVYGGANGPFAVKGCTIVNNIGASYGGGLYISGESVFDGGLVEDCVIAYNVGNRGGGVYAIKSVSTWPALKMRNCLIYGNYPGGMRLEDIGVWTGYVENCTVFGNYSTSVGAGIYMLGTNPVRNTIVWSNHPTATAEIFCDTVAGSNFLEYCCAPVALPGAGNTTAYPLLIDPGSGYGTNHVAGNYRLAGGSPVINAGTNQPWMLDAAVDLDGRTRADRFSGRVDIGCYEYLPSGAMFRMR